MARLQYGPLHASLRFGPAPAQAGRGLASCLGHISGAAAQRLLCMAGQCCRAGSRGLHGCLK
jgi:hypothetical protein